MKKLKALFGMLAIASAIGFISCSNGAKYEEPENAPAKGDEGFVSKYLTMKEIEAGTFKFKYGADDTAVKVTTNNAVVGRLIMQQQLILLTTVMTSVNIMSTSNIG